MLSNRMVKALLVWNPWCLGWGRSHWDMWGHISGEVGGSPAVRLECQTVTGCRSRLDRNTRLWDRQHLLVEERRQLVL